MEAAMSLIENMASAPQLLVVLVIEGLRLYRNGAKTKTLREMYAGLAPPELMLIAWQSALASTPSSIIALSIFFVRF